MKNFFKTLWKDESGQGATEYILILVVAAAVVFVVKEPLMEMVTSKTEALSGKMDEVFN